MNYFTGQTQILVDIQECDRLRITVDFAALLMTRPGGTHSNISMKVHKIAKTGDGTSHMSTRSILRAKN